MSTRCGCGLAQLGAIAGLWDGVEHVRDPRAVPLRVQVVGESFQWARGMLGWSSMQDASP